MTNSSGHGDLVVVAIVISLVLHGLLMFFAAPHVMSRTGSASLEANRTRHPPMAVKRFKGDPMRGREKTAPKEDVPAPRAEPQVSSMGSAAPASAEADASAP